MIRFLFALLMVATLAGIAIAGPAESSHDSGGWGSTEYLQRLRQDAEQGNSLAQYLLGVVYSKGEGVPQDFAEAVKWLRRAADQGVVPAQFFLGGMYAMGEGVPADIVRAHMWFNLAGAHTAQEHTQVRDAQKMRDMIARKMTPAQIAEAQKLAREWKPQPER
jgi:TPR repeat protein